VLIKKIIKYIYTRNVLMVTWCTVRVLGN